MVDITKGIHMTVQHYRLCFDPPQDRLFKNFHDFSSWCAQHLADFDYSVGGYIVLDWAHVPSRRVGPHWFVIIPGSASFRDGDQDVVCFLAETAWKVDGVTAILYLKENDDNEVLFPIHTVF